MQAQNFCLDSTIPHLSIMPVAQNIPEIHNAAQLIREFTGLSHIQSLTLYILLKMPTREIVLNADDLTKLVGCTIATTYSTLKIFKKLKWIKVKEKFKSFKNVSVLNRSKVNEWLLGHPSLVQSLRLDVPFDQDILGSYLEKYT